MPNTSIRRPSGAEKKKDILCCDVVVARRSDYSVGTAGDCGEIQGGYTVVEA